MSDRIHPVWVTIGAALAIAATTLAVSVPVAETGARPKCFGKAATIVRGNGDSNINGTNGPDVIVAGNGENDIDGKAGNDRICGGKDGDDVFGNKGDDKMSSGGSIDFIAGNKGDDLHVAGGGDDQVDAVQDSLSSDNDVVKGKGGGDFLDVLDDEGNDAVSGGDGNDSCMFDVGDDVAGSCEA